MPVRQAAGVLYVATALVSGFWEISLMLRPLIGGPWSWWYVLTLGASVLLLVGGVHTVVPEVRGAWLVALAVIVPLVLWSLFRDGSWVWLVFTVVTALVAWGLSLLLRRSKEARSWQSLQAWLWLHGGFRHLCVPWVSTSHQDQAAQTLGNYFRR